jgi:hypothetical protein
LHGESLPGWAQQRGPFGFRTVHRFSGGAFGNGRSKGNGVGIARCAARTACDNAEAPFAISYRSTTESVPCRKPPVTTAHTRIREQAPRPPAVAPYPSLRHTIQARPLPLPSLYQRDIHCDLLAQGAGQRYPFHQPTRRNTYTYPQAIAQRQGGVQDEPIPLPLKVLYAIIARFVQIPWTRGPNSNPIMMVVTRLNQMPGPFTAV